MSIEIKEFGYIITPPGAEWDAYLVPKWAIADEPKSARLLVRITKPDVRFDEVIDPIKYRILGYVNPFSSEIYLYKNGIKMSGQFRQEFIEAMAKL